MTTALARDREYYRVRIRLMLDITNGQVRPAVGGESVAVRVESARKLGGRDLDNESTARQLKSSTTRPTDAFKDKKQELEVSNWRVDELRHHCE